MHIVVEKPTPQELNSLGVNQWPIWQKQESAFDWHYEDKEICYLLGEERLKLVFSMAVPLALVEAIW